MSAYFTGKSVSEQYSTSAKLSTRETKAYQARQASLTGGAIGPFRVSLRFGFSEVCLSIGPHTSSLTDTLFSFNQKIEVSVIVGSVGRTNLSPGEESPGYAGFGLLLIRVAVFGDLRLYALL